MLSKNLRVRKSPASRSLSILTTLLAFTVILAALSACSNASDDAIPTPIPPPTSAPYSSSKELLITPQEYESLEVHLLAGDILTVIYASFQGRLTIPNAPPASLGDPVEILLIGPQGKTVLEVEALQENQLELRVDRTGNYRMVFTNPHSRRGIAVVVEYAVNP